MHVVHHKKTVVPKPLGTEAAVLAPRHRAGVKAATELPCSHSETESEVIRSCSETTSPSREPLEYHWGQKKAKLTFFFFELRKLTHG